MTSDGTDVLEEQASPSPDADDFAKRAGDDAGRASATTAEARRLEESRTRTAHWKRWGPYLAERAWGTVREDYSPDGKAWDYLPHDHARSKAYRWNEDGIGGICDRHQLMCFAVALWNGRDPILKERLYGLTGEEGNHGEDVKEYYFYLDSTPTHSYMKFLYKYPQAEFPYARLLEESRRRGRGAPEFELLDAGVFDDDRYFDVFVEYAKVGVEDILVRVSVTNRGPETAQLHLLPTLWFRNTWSWDEQQEGARPRLACADGCGGEEGAERVAAVEAREEIYGTRWLYCEGTPELLFTENETNAARLYNAANPTPFVKDGIGDYVVNDDPRAVNPAQEGTKAAALYVLDIGPGETATVRLRLTDQSPASFGEVFGDSFEHVFAERRREADEFYATVIPADLSEDARNVMRQSFAGMLWSKQFYHYVIKRWLEGDPLQPAPPAGRKAGRNHDWPHLYNADVISMPDKWEYPWYAVWDLAFHCVPLALVDPDFAKEQLILVLREWYMHPNGQIPAYEWAFGDVNPPVHAWAAWRVYKIDEKRRGKGDREFLERVFHKLLLNFTWWVNRKDEDGNNVFQGGFLGMDNVGVFDRSQPLPTGGHLAQSDGTSWMAMYTLNLLAIALELAKTDPVYEDVASKFWEHFLYIAHAMNNIGPDNIALWDEEDGFYYDVLHLHGQGNHPIKVRSMVGPDPALRGRDVGAGSARQAARLQEAARMVHRQPARPDRRRGLHAHARSRRAPPALGRLSRPAAPRAAADARRVGVPLALRRALRLALPPGAPVRFAPQRHRAPRRLRAGGEFDRSVRRQLELARPRLVPPQLPAHRVAAKVPPLPRRRLPGRVPDRLRRDDESVGGGGGTLAPPLAHLPARRGRAAPRLRRRREVPARPALARPPALPRILPRRRRRGTRSQPPDRLDGPRREAAPTERRIKKVMRTED